MVIHTGDIVDNATNLSQWQNANDSMGILLDAGIPYCWAAGNHDQLGLGLDGGNPNLDWLGSQYLAFNDTNKIAQSYWVDDYLDSKNTAVQFSYGQYSFLIINLEYHANSLALAWMKNIINKNMGSNVIVATHSYLNESAGYGYSINPSWENNLRTILDKISDVFLTLSGHIDVGRVQT